MTKERLIFKGVSEIVGTNDLGLLILTEDVRLTCLSLELKKDIFRTFYMQH